MSSPRILVRNVFKQVVTGIVGLVLKVPYVTVFYCHVCLVIPLSVLTCLLFGFVSFSTRTKRIMFAFVVGSFLAKASLGPYAWERRDAAKVVHAKRFHNTEATVYSNKRVKVMDWKDDEGLNGLPRAWDVFSLIDNDPLLSYRLPTPGATAGRVLKHAYSVFERLQREHKPMIFKIGITHCAHFRMYNPLFGYKGGADKFEHLCVIFASAEPYGPAFLEAAMIDRFIGNLFGVVDVKIFYPPGTLPMQFFV